MALEGNLQSMALSDLIQVFHTDAKTGILFLKGTRERGVIYVADGRLIDAVVVRGKERTIVATRDAAVLQMLTWEHADFIFRYEPTVRKRPVRIVHGGQCLILEGMRRRADPVRTLPYYHVTPETILQLAAPPCNVRSGVRLNIDQWRVLSWIAGGQNVHTICQATGLDIEVAISLVIELMAIGLVEIAPCLAPTTEPAYRDYTVVPSSPSVYAHDIPYVNKHSGNFSSVCGTMEPRCSEIDLLEVITCCIHQL
jgi:hypothetical protein